MPIFEYKCKECNSKFEMLHKSSTTIEEVVCPKCSNKNVQKLFSSFSSNVQGASLDSGCSTGNCSVPTSYSPCANGMCGLN